MNRLKFWLFALILMCAAAFGMRWLALDLRKKAIDGIDRQLLAAQAQAEAAERSLSAELVAVASLAGQDEQLGLTLLRQPEAPGGKRKPGQPPPPTIEQLDEAVTQAASEAVSKSVQLLGAAQGKREVFATSLDGFQRREAGDEDVTAFLQDGLDRKVRRGYAVLKGQLNVGAGVPLGNDAGALALFTPVDESWAKAASAGTGASLFLLVGPKTVVASGRGNEADALAKLARAGVAPGDAGSLGPVDVSVAKIQLPKVASFLGPLPADRVLSRPLAGVKEGRLVLAVSARPVLEPIVRLEWYAAAALAVVLLLTIIFGFLIRPTEVASPVPPALLEVARKIAKGDFSARAPVLAGKVGTVAEALNKAAEVAQAGGAAEPVRGTLTSEFFAKGAEPEPPAEPASDPFVLPERAPRAAPLAEPEPAPAPEPIASPEPLPPAAPEPTGETRAVSDTARLDGANLTGAAFEAAPVPAPRPAPAPAPAPAPVAAPSELLSGAARAAPAGEGGEEEQHWRDVFRDFVRTRGECGESAEGLTYERFRQKLEANKGALVAKYGCRTVRFQVYVKDGKAALKATPVR